MRRFTQVLAAAAALALAAGAVPAAETQAFRADYTVSYLGLPVASARFDSSFADGRFEIDGQFASTGLARLFDKTTGTTRVSGRFGRNGIVPDAFRASYVSGKKRGETTIRFEDGKVTRASSKPRSKRGKTWIPVPGDELLAAFDPLSWTLVRTSDPAEVCDRTIRLFDGEMRADIALTHKSTGTLRGFPGEAVTCEARFQPVAGYRKGRQQIEYLRDHSRISVTFVRLADTGFFTPVDAVIGTQVGPVRISASSIEAR